VLHPGFPCAFFNRILGICYCLSMVLHDSAKGTTDRVCNFYCLGMVLRHSAEATTDRVRNL
jgi:hypothetical protein